MVPVDVRQSGAQRAAGEQKLEVVVAVAARVLQGRGAGGVVGRARQRRVGERRLGIGRAPRFVGEAAEGGARALHTVTVVGDDDGDRHQRKRMEARSRTLR